MFIIVYHKSDSCSAALNFNAAPNLAVSQIELYSTLQVNGWNDFGNNVPLLTLTCTATGVLARLLCSITSRCRLYK